MNKPVQQHQQVGFTLIEVLVALAIVAFVGLSVQMRVGEFLDQRHTLTNRQQAHWVAWNQLMENYQQARYGVSESGRQPAKQGEVISLGREWHFDREETATQSRQMRRVRVAVTEVMSSSSFSASNTSASALLNSTDNSSSQINPVNRSDASLTLFVVAK